MPHRGIIVGAGHRSRLYAASVHHHPDEMQIVGGVDLNEQRRREVAAGYQLSDEVFFATTDASFVSRHIDPRP